MNEEIIAKIKEVDESFRRLVYDLSFITKVNPDIVDVFARFDELQKLLNAAGFKDVFL